MTWPSVVAALATGSVLCRGGCGSLDTRLSLLLWGNVAELLTNVHRYLPVDVLLKCFVSLFQSDRAGVSWRLMLA